MNQGQDGTATAESRTEQGSLAEELALIVSNETTARVLVYLVERSGSPREIGEALGISTSKASHHVKKLLRLQLVELIEEKEVGGAIQHIYRAVICPDGVSTQEWDKLSLAERQRYSIWIVRMILADAAISFQANVFDARTNTHLSRTPMVVDEQGLTEVAAIQARALSEIIQVEATSAGRMVSTGEGGFNIIAAMMCFELPRPSDGLRSRRHDS
jgi:predicted DNA-binding transcriptional regulator